MKINIIVIIYCLNKLDLNLTIVSSTDKMFNL